MTDRHTKCRGRLKVIRDKIKGYKLKIPLVYVYTMAPEHYSVFIGDTLFGEYETCCAKEAKVVALTDYLKLQKEDK